MGAGGRSQGRGEPQEKRKQKERAEWEFLESGSPATSGVRFVPSEGEVTYMGAGAGVQRLRGESPRDRAGSRPPGGRGSLSWAGSGSEVAGQRGSVLPLRSRVGGRGRGHLEQHEELEETAEGGWEEPRVGHSHFEEERVEEPVAHVDERVGVEVRGAGPARGGRASAAATAVGPGPRGPGRRVLRHAAQRRALTARGSSRAPPGRHQHSSPPRYSRLPGRRRHLPPPRP